MTTMNEGRLEPVIDIFLQGAGNISSALLGMINKVGGQIYALLFISDEPMSLDAISERLCVSKSNVSINIRMLEDYRLVKKVWVKGSRKDYYTAVREYPNKVLKDFLEKIMSTLKEAITTIERTRTKLAELKPGLSEQEMKQSEFLLNQVNLIGLFYYAANQYFEDFFNGKKVDIEILRRIIVGGS